MVKVLYVTKYVHDQTNQKGKKYAEVYSAGKIKHDEFCELIATECGFKASQVKNVMAAMYEVMHAKLAQGHSVELDKIGKFSLSLSSKAQSTKRGVIRGEKKFKVNFREAYTTSQTDSKTGEQKRQQVNCLTEGYQAVEKKTFRGKQEMKAEDMA